MATFRWTHPLAPGPVTDVAARAIGPTTVRVTWVGNSESDHLFVSATLRGWDHGFPVSADTGSVDFEGLARGGRYTFSVEPTNDDRFAGAIGVLASSAHMSLGQRGTGPQAPSDLSWAMTDDGQVHVSWKDNSSDELGFEVQSTLAGSGSSRRVGTVPPDTESIVISSNELLVRDLRIFAYNERGFSASSPPVHGVANVVWLTATTGDAEVCLYWTMSPWEWPTGTQVRWKRTAELPFDDVVDTWTDLPALASEYIVRGLANGTEYTFEVRAAAASGAGPAMTVTATPRAPRKVSFRLDIPCDEELCRTLTGTPVSFVGTSGGSVTERHWSFGDGAGSDRRSPTHAWSSPGYYDVTLTVSDGSSSGSATRTVLVEAAAPAGSCRVDAETLCLRDSRFEVKMYWWSAAGESAAGRVVHAGTNESGLFWFFDPKDWEVLIRVRDGCAINGHYWLFVVAATDLPYGMAVVARFGRPTVLFGIRGFSGHRGPFVDKEYIPGLCAAGAVPSLPIVENLTATAGNAEVGLTWLVPYAETVTGMQARWKVSADLPFDDAVDAWTDLPASAREYTVTGLRNDTEYTFAVRALSASGAGSVATATATPRAPPRVPPKASFSVNADCFDDPCRLRTGEAIRFTDTSTGNVTQRNWSFGDGAASDLRSPTHAWSTPGFYGVTLTVSDGSSSDSATRTLLVEAAAPAGSCRFDAETLCLRDSRFKVKANWWSADGESGPGRVVYSGTNDSGLFRFFDPLNWEILIKVLDGCAINGRMWVLGASTTDLGYRILVTDTVTGESRSYLNEPGQPAPAIVDTEAFPAPCSLGAAAR